MVDLSEDYESYERKEIPYFDSKNNARELVLQFLEHTSTYGDATKSYKNEFVDKPVAEGLWTLETASNFLVNENFSQPTDSIISYDFSINSFRDANNQEMLSGHEMVEKFDEIFDFINEAKLACNPKVVDLYQAYRQGDTYNLSVAIALGCSSSGSSGGSTGGGTTTNNNCPPSWPASMVFDWYDNLVGQELTTQINNCLTETCGNDGNPQTDCIVLYEHVTIFSSENLTDDIAVSKSCYPNCGLFLIECNDFLTWTSENVTTPVTQNHAQITNFPFQAARTVEFAEFIVQNPLEFNFPILDSEVANEIKLHEIVVRADAIFLDQATDTWLTLLETLIIAKESQ